MESLHSAIFRIWYKRIGGSSISLDFENREIKIFDRNGHPLAIMDFAKNIDTTFDLADLFKVDLEAGEYEYHVFPDINNYIPPDTLYRVQIGPTYGKIS